MHVRRRLANRIAGPGSTREAVLARLRAHAGEWVSGQVMADGTGMSRAAVWKQIGSLRAEGYGIEAVTHRGYRLRDIPDVLLPAEIRHGLGTKTIGQGEIRHDERTTSTNDVAKEMAALGAAEGSLAVAEEQTRGRGRLARTWFSPPGGGLYVSIVLRPVLLPVHAARLVPLAAVAVADAGERA
jgi:BirA family transcriptional regulator, biotin operon repressor / biotin---[acetyl-CoA-carboxylase] ligase